jgi:serine/threonine protein kinase
VPLSIGARVILQLQYLPTMRLSVGERLGPYEIVAPLGAGGMGEVYQARDIRLERDVAIKLVSAQSADPGSHKRLQLEARSIWRALSSLPTRKGSFTAT